MIFHVASLAPPHQMIQRCAIITLRPLLQGNCLDDTDEDGVCDEMYLVARITLLAITVLLRQMTMIRVCTLFQLRLFR